MHNGPIDNSMRSMNNSAMSSYDQQMQQYQQQNPSSFHLRQMSTVDPLFHDQGVNSIQAAHAIDQSSRDQGVNSIQAGHAIDQSFRDQGVHSIQAAHATDHSFRDQGVNSIQAAHAIDQSFRDQNYYFMKFDLKTLFCIFYTMPKDEAHLCAANELCSRGWFYHKELQTWFSRIPDKEPLVKASTYERGSYKAFDILTWEHKQKENFVLQFKCKFSGLCVSVFVRR